CGAHASGNGRRRTGGPRAAPPPGLPPPAPARNPLGGGGEEKPPPIGVPVSTEREKVLPAVDPGRMHVVENEPHRVIADRIDLENGDVLLAGDGLALVG